MSFMQDQYRGYRHPFVAGIYYFGGVGDSPRTVTELAMSQSSANLRSQPNWWNEYHDPLIRNKWAKMIGNRVWTVRTPAGEAEVKLSPAQVDYLVDELSGYAALRDPKNGHQVSCFERIWESMSFQGSSTLYDHLSVLRPPPSTHRKRSSPFIHLIDPFLYPLIYEKSFVSLSRTSSKNPPSQIQISPHITPAPVAGDVHSVSTHSAFLPSTVYIPPLPAPDNPVKFISYINNLHPTLHAPLYTLLSSLLTYFVPLFEQTLTDLHRNNPLMQRIPGTCRYTVWDEPEEPEYSDDEEGWAKYEVELKDWVMNRPIALPDVPASGYPGELECRKHVVNLGGRTVQVIVDVTEMRLEAGDPPYSGSHWHVKGMQNERIVACGLYFTSIENLKPSSLEFRMAVTYPRGFIPGDVGATLRTWGMRGADPCHQYIGTRAVQSGLALTFPNIYQHRQTSFSLLDPTKPGHQMVVSFFLVDPEVNGVLGTVEVAPQQKEWVRMAVDEAIGERIPGELVDQIVDWVDGVMDLPEAVQYAREMRGLREKYRKANDTAYFCIPFDIHAYNTPEAQ